MLDGIFMTSLNFFLRCTSLQLSIRSMCFDVHNLPWIGISFIAVMLSGLCGGLFSFLWDCLCQWIVMMLTIAAIMLLV